MQILFRRRNHKEEHFERLFSEMYPRLVRFATTLMDNTEEAKDIVSETMEQAWKEFDQLKENTRSAWLYAAVRNGCLNRLKHLNVEQQHIDRLTEATRAEMNQGYRAHEALLQQAENIAHSLPEPTCTILRSCYWEKKNISTGSRRTGNQPRHREKTYIKSIADSARSDAGKGGETMKKEFSTNDHIHPDSGKDTHNQSSQENGTWNDHQLEQLFGEALGDTPTADETRKAWQTFIRRHRIRHQSIRRIMILGIAAAVIALALVFQPLLQPEQQEVEVFTSLEVPEEITFRKEGKRIIVNTPPATITSVQLSDGSKVLLSANSRLEYQKEFTDTIRSVKLSGEARFEVAKDASRPFIVCTEQLQTRVLGTVFDVKAYPRYSPDVILYQGRVNVSHTKRRQSREMHPGEQISLDKQGKLQLKRVDTEKRKGWAENKFSFDNTDLRQVMQEIGSWYNISIVFRSRPLLDERIYFHINRQLPMNTVLDALNDLKIAQFTMKEGKIIVETPQDKKR